MKERPILFSAPMVRAILGGRKTQTRRIMKAQPWQDAQVTVEPYHPIVLDRDGYTHPGAAVFGAVWGDGPSDGLPCPYGQPGDMLWVRESGAWSGGVAAYAATDQKPLGAKWRPSIHMPRWASRITLRITDIRVERLQDISCPDAEAEGAGHHAGLTGGQARGAFALLWDQINGYRAWDANPWVWVVSFEMVTP